MSQRWKIYIVIVAIICLIIGASIGYVIKPAPPVGIPAEEYEKLKADYEALKADYEKLKAENEALKKEIERLRPAPPPPKVIKGITHSDIPPESWEKAFELAKERWPELAEFKLEVMMPPDPKTAFFTAFEAGEAPQIVVVDSFEVPSWVEAGYLYPLTEFLEEWDGVLQFPKPLLDMVTWRGGVYALPYQTDVRVIWTRKDILIEKGIGWPYQVKGLDEWLEVARTLKAKGVEYPIALQSSRAWGEGTTMQAFLPLLWACGGDLYDWSKRKWIVSSEAYLKVLNFYRTIYKEEFANPEVPRAARPWEICLKDFQEGRTVFYIDGNWAMGAFWPGGDYEIPDAPEKVDFMLIPGLPGKFASASGGWCFAMARKGRGIPPDWPEVAWKIMSVFYSSDLMADYCIKRPWLPPRADVAAREDFKKALPLFVRMSEEVLPYTRYRPALPEYPKISEYIQLMVEEVATLKKTPEEALRDFAAKVRDLVGSENIIDELGILKG
mgnify:FL=1